MVDRQQVFTEADVRAIVRLAVFGGPPLPEPTQEQVDAVVDPTLETLRGQLAFGDEPVFVVRARDAAAPATIIGWMTEARRLGVAQSKIDAANAHAKAIIDWQYAHPDLLKVPD